MEIWVEQTQDSVKWRVSSVEFSLWVPLPKRSHLKQSVYSVYHLLKLKTPEF
jgi:hypothetical protein